MLSVRTAVAVAAVALMSAGTAVAGSIAPVSDGVLDQPKTLDQGSSVGTFDAQGRGVVVVRGNLTIYGNMTGVMSIRDRTNTAVVRINGILQRGRLVAGTRIYSFPRGTRAFYAQGRNIRVALSTGRRGRLNISAFGRGVVYRMRGRGTYSINSAPPRSWLSARLPLQIRPVGTQP